MDEKLIARYMKTLDLSREEAIQLIKDEEEDFENVPEVAEMTAKAKKLPRNYVKSAETKKRAPKERKVDEEKKRILLDIKCLLEGLGAEVTNIQTETVIEFNYGKENYSVKLTKHRPKK